MVQKRLSALDCELHLDHGKHKVLPPQKTETIKGLTLPIVILLDTG